MTSFLEKLVARSWNSQTWDSSEPENPAESVILGRRVVDGRLTSGLVMIAPTVRTQHIVSTGKTGFGKTSAIKNAIAQDVRGGHGFLVIDHHGDLSPFVLRTVARQERRSERDLSGRLILLDLTDSAFSPGFNPLEGPSEFRFRQAGEIAALLRNRFDLATLGSRTEEFHRNSIHLLADAGMTLVDAPAVLPNPGFIQALLRSVTNEEVRSYFLNRYLGLSEQFQATIREPVLNKLSMFIGDPRFRHVLGQSNSTFSPLEAMDRGAWVVASVDVGKLGPEATTFAGLILTWLRNSMFRRKNTRLFTIYADEVQRLVAHADALASFFSESRKYGVGISSANQYLEQHPAEVRAALLSAANFILFRLSAPDAEKFSSHLDGGKHLAELLKNLPQRNVVVKTGDRRWQQAVISEVDDTQIDIRNLYERCRARWMKPRAEVEAAIRQRQQQSGPTGKDALNDWE